MKYQNIKILNDTHHKLKILSAQKKMKFYELIDFLYDFFIKNKKEG